MAKTCRTCNSAHYVRSCPMIGTKRRAEVWPDEEDCYYHKLRETPLLVDELAGALGDAVALLQIYTPGTPWLDYGWWLLARYEKERDGT